MADCLILPPQPPKVLTCDDIIRAGACNGGVASRLQRVTERMQVAAAMEPAKLLKIVPAEEQRHILAAIDQSPSDASGYGNGDGYGNGYGDGNGYGYGYGDGDGYGNGYGTVNNSDKIRESGYGK